MNYKDINIEYIINYCKEHNEVAWLKAKASEKTIQKRHTGKIKGLNKAGKEVWLVDKNSPKEEIKTNITFIEIKRAFAEKFMPEILPKAEKSPKSILRI